MTLLSSFTREGDAPSLNIVIIGATGGIGGAMIEALTHEPMLKTLYCCSRSNFSVDSYGDVENCLHHIPIDITNEETIVAAANTIASSGTLLDVVIVATGLLHYNDGLKPEKSLQHLTADNFFKNMAANALGPALVAKHFLPLLNKKTRSFFGAFSARVGSISDNGLGGWHSYRSSKAAVNMLLKNIAIESKRKYPQLIIAGLHPGTVNTTLSEPFQKNVKPEKLFTPEFSAKQLLSVIDNLTLDNSGDCFAWDGKKIPA